MDNPKIYVADLAAYNEGKLIGKWFDMTDYSSGSELVGAINDFLKEAGEQQGVEREEWAVHDYENIPSDLIGEYSGEKEFDQIYKIINLAEENDLPVEVLMEFASQKGIDIDDIDDLEYFGRYSSESDFADEAFEMGVNNPEYYLDMTYTDMRLFAGEEADNQVDNMDNDEILDAVSDSYRDSFERAEQIDAEIEEFENDIEEIQEKIDELYGDSEDKKEGDVEEMDDEIQRYRDEIDHIKEGINSLYQERSRLDYKSEEDAVDAAREELKSSIYDDIYRELEKDAVGYFVDNLGYSIDQLQNNGFYVDTDRLLRDLEYDYMLIRHDDEVYVFRNS